MSTLKSGPRLESMTWDVFQRHSRAFCVAHSVYSEQDAEALPRSFRDHWHRLRAEARRRGQQLTLFDADAL